MKFEIESQDIEAIAQRVSEIIKPMLNHSVGSNEKDVVFDVRGLAEYLRVKESWVYQQVHTHSLPCFKVGKYPRFKKAQIDKWMESKAVRPIPALTAVKRRGVST